MNETVKNNGSLTVDIEISNPCFKCNGDCDTCPHWVDEVDYDSIKNEAAAFRLSLSVDLRRHNEIKINL